MVINTRPPLHASHRPPFRLKLKRPGLVTPRLRRGEFCRKYLLLGVKSPVYVAGFERGVLPIGGLVDYNYLIDIFQAPIIPLCFPVFLLHDRIFAQAPYREYH